MRSHNLLSLIPTPTPNLMQKLDQTSRKIQGIQVALPLNISMDKGQSSFDFNQYAKVQLWCSITTLYTIGINKLQP